MTPRSVPSQDAKGWSGLYSTIIVTGTITLTPHKKIKHLTLKTAEK